MALLRLVISGLLAFCFYAAWAYFANSLVTNDTQILFKAALVQGSYSGAITLFFTFLLEYFHAKHGHASFCLSFVMPRWSSHTKAKPCKTLLIFDDALERVKHQCAGNCIAGMLVVPLPALLIQTVLVITINVAFSTPNLWLTVAPSIIFSALYGYSYSITLTKRQQRASVTNA
ncbi:hypothetical protein ACFO4O_10250 [Glaciecola siphonariae]|uniref:Uncharacterized protein n=1 Tax=Glaciecola siphonariae TaxID=521012 RepID=A0ABV9LVJ4_9ALTE